MVCTVELKLLYGVFKYADFTTSEVAKNILKDSQVACIHFQFINLSYAL